MYGFEVSDSLARDDPLELGVIPCPVLTLVLVLPTSEEYKQHRRSAREQIDVAEN